MKIRITRESASQYFAEVVGATGIHAVAETPDLALQYLLDVYEQAAKLTKEKLHKKIFVDRSLPNAPLLSTSFKSLELNF